MASLVAPALQGQEEILAGLYGASCEEDLASGKVQVLELQVQDLRAAQSAVCTEKDQGPLFHSGVLEEAVNLTGSIGLAVFFRAVEDALHSPEGIACH